MSFPIYRVRWETPGINSVSFHPQMLRTRDQEGEFFTKLAKGAKEHALTKNQGHADGRLVWEFWREDTWCLEWFCHKTFRDRFDNPGAVLADFEKYVRRIEREFPPGLPVSMMGEDYVCLMGAEERWRWRGDGRDSPAPCECASCELNGWWRINH